MDARIYKKMLKNIVENEVRTWGKDKLKKAGINASVTVVYRSITFEKYGPFVSWRCPVILHGYADEAHIGAFVDIVVTGTIMERVLIDGCEFLDREKEIAGTYGDNQRIERFEELYDGCAV